MAATPASAESLKAAAALRSSSSAGGRVEARTRDLSPHLAASALRSSPSAAEAGTRDLSPRAAAAERKEQYIRANVLKPRLESLVRWRAKSPGEPLELSPGVFRSQVRRTVGSDLGDTPCSSFEVGADTAEQLHSQGEDVDPAARIPALLARRATPNMSL